MAASATSGDRPSSKVDTDEDDISRRLSELERRAAAIEALLAEVLRTVER